MTINNDYHSIYNYPLNKNFSRSKTTTTTTTNNPINIKNNVSFKGYDWEDDYNSTIRPHYIGLSFRPENEQQALLELRCICNHSTSPEGRIGYEINTLDKCFEIHYNAPVGCHIIDGNKVSLEYKGKESVVELPEDFIKPTMSDKEKELFVKTWIYEAKRFNQYNRIPVELLRGMRDIGFDSRYQDIHCRDVFETDKNKTVKENSDIYTTLLKKGIENGVEIKEFINKDDYKREMHVEIYGEPYVIELDRAQTVSGEAFAFEKSHFIKAAAKDEEYSDSQVEIATAILDTIKGTLCGKFVTDNGKDVFIPNIYKGIPTFKDNVLLKYGNAKADDHTSNAVADSFRNAANIYIDKSKLKQINYTESLSENKQAFSYYDRENDTFYLYFRCPDDKHSGIIMKKDKFGKISQMELPYCSEVKEQKWERIGMVAASALSLAVVGTKHLIKNGVKLVKKM